MKVHGIFMYVDVFLSQPVICKSNEKGSKTELMVKWLTAVCDILPGALLREGEMQVLYAFKCHLTH